MKALVKAKPEKGIWLQNVAEPKIGPGDVLINVRKSAICGTDMHIFNWDAWAQRTIPVPMIVGHEFVGEICKVGANVVGLAPGDRVSAEGHVTCGTCRNCRAGRRHLCPNTIGIGVNRPGSFAEYVAVPSENVYRLPDSVDDDIAAIFDPFGNAVHTALSFDLVGEDVLVTGAGAIGMMAALVAQRAGARHVVLTDVADGRLDLAIKLGVIHTVNVQTGNLRQTMAELGIKEGFDVGLEMSGSSAAFNQMLDTLTNGAKVALLGIPPAEFGIDWNKVIFKGLTIKGIYGREMFETWYKMTALLESGLNLNPLITHHFPIAEFDRGFEAMASGSAGKVILHWQ
jgi:threonine 3-dehydrogenase